ncbi:tRNA-splicing endonuclease subunit sen54 [Vanrija albida]|uniref:tRNA-splicing endonuclease subunit sen54 n=1 Tax=Vanrija albida TaxID=181172 RepID=A0ABR3PX92_9TREE
MSRVPAPVRSSDLPKGEGSRPSTKPSVAQGSKHAAPTPTQPQEGEEEDDDQRMDVAFIQSFSDKIQRLPSELLDGFETSRSKITIPKRGEKDFEPLEETVNLQEMMLQNSRQALFDALQGVRGAASKSLSHAVVTPSSPFPQLIVSRGHVLDSVGITVRRSITEGDQTKTTSRVELLPEEAMYMAERGTLQIWNGRDPETEEDRQRGVGEWCDEEFGVRGAVEMSVMEVFGAFMGKEALTWQRYQAYTVLKRLGYTVQRTRAFIPEHFLSQQPEPPRTSFVGSILGLLRSVPRRLRALACRLFSTLKISLRRLSTVGLGITSLWSNPLRGTALASWSGDSYGSMYSELRFIPSGHSQPTPQQGSSAPVTSIYDALERNPYLPFFHVWKPVTAWSKAKWDRGSTEGLGKQKPDYILAVVESRDTPLPTLSQLSEVFDLLPDEPTTQPKRVGPQYANRPAPRAAPPPAADSRLQKWLGWLCWWQTPPSGPQGNAMHAMRNGDRGLIVAVNDSGNTGWVRFGRTGFENYPMV